MGIMKSNQREEISWLAWLLEKEYNDLNDVLLENEM